ncbi:hypothetical protein PG985_016148 [Apiospora marii]|uniref:uncharacterized protein n=1 Tax=Apiospora marii TaxID=335849 RepID=UPI00312EEA1B
MTCSDVGTTNPDIAGLGIILSFTIQAGLSVLLSAWSFWIEYRRQIYNELFITPPRDMPSQRNVQNGQSQAAEDRHGGNDPEHHMGITDGHSLNCNSTTFSAPIFTVARIPRTNTKLGIRLVHRVLTVIGTTQLLNGISLVIGALAQHQTLSLYHFHIIYDIVSFTGISAAAAVATTSSRTKGFLFTGLLLTVFMLLYLLFIIIFGRVLQSWDDGVSGRCYMTSAISSPASAHPLVDHAYLAVTAIYMFGSLFFCIPGARAMWLNPSKFSPQSGRYLLTKMTMGYSFNPARIDSVLGLALMQYPLHGYMVYALRLSNEKHLSGNSENEWGFGQIVALISIVAVFLECIKAVAADARTEYNLLKKPPEALVDTERSSGFVNFFRALFLETDEVPGPVLPERIQPMLPNEHELTVLATPNNLPERPERPRSSPATF